MSSSLAPLFGITIIPAAKGWQFAFELARQADESGLDLLAVQDHPYLGNFVDSWTLLAMLGAATRRVQLLPDVLNLPLRPPAMLAKAAATLDLLTSGRFEMGLGAGAQWDAIASLQGPRRSKDEAVRSTEEAMAVMRTFWDSPAPDQKVNYGGDFYQLTNAQAGPLPAHRIGIWLGAYGPRMLRLIGRRADGWLPSAPYLGPELMHAAQEIIDNAARKAGREPSDIRRGYNIFGAITRPGDPAIRTTRPNAIIGSASEWVETLVRYARELHVDTFIFWPITGDVSGQVRLFAEEVVPAVRGVLSAED